MGNVGSIANMLKRSGFEVRLGSSPDDIAEASKLILPGVGSFDAGMENLHRLGLPPLLAKKVFNGTRFLGICLGMQLLFEGSEEGQQPGLGWLRGRCARFRFAEGTSSLKIPHMGWNDVRPVHRDSLFRDMAPEAGFYFVHSYHVVCDDASDVLAWATHGYEFPAAVQHENLYGTQFHPEKSHKYGRALLTRFADS